MNNNYYRDLDKIAMELGDYALKYGRLGGQVKEKYGTVRFYVDFNDLTLHSLIYPGYYYNQFPTWLYTFDYKVVERLLRPFNGLWHRYQRYIYKRAYKHVLTRYPQYRKEILCCADYPEYLEGI